MQKECGAQCNRGQVTQEFSTLNEAVSNLADRTILLLGRLSSIRYMEEKPCDKTGTPDINLCSFADNIRTTRRTVDNVTDLVNEAIIDLQI
jgi:hypothetical protein